MLENSPYTESDVQTALQMTADGVAVSQICDHLGCARQTYYNWKNEGLLTEGKPWDEWLENHHATEVLRQENELKVEKVESADEFWQDQIPRLRAAVKDTIEKLADGSIPMDAQDLETVVSLIRKVENRGQELAMLQEEFMRAVFFAVREEVDKQTFQFIKEKVKEIRLDQLQEYDEEYAQSLMEDVR